MSHRFRITTPSVVVRRALFESVGGFDEELQYCEDYDLWIRLALRSPLAFIDRSLTITRYRDDHFPSPQIEVQQDWARVMRKHVQDPMQFVRRIAKQRLALHEVALARCHATAGRAVDSLRHLVSALSSSPFALGAWREALLLPVRLARHKFRKIYLH